VPERLVDHRVVARNTAAHGENAIHDDAVARRYGFRGGLVPGVAVYAYLTYPLVAALGPAWLERGTATVRFLTPVLDGEEVSITGEVATHDARRITASVSAGTAAAPACATLTATLPAGSPTPVNIALYGTAPLPDPRPEASRAHLASLPVLGTPVTRYDDECARQWLARVSDELPLYRGPHGRVHPAFYLDQANRALDRNVKMGPWIHVGSVVRHLRPAAVGDTLLTLGKVRSLFEKKGREFVEIDLVVAADGGRRPVAHVLHTAIYRLAPPA